MNCDTGEANFISWDAINKRPARNQEFVLVEELNAIECHLRRLFCHPEDKESAVTTAPKP